MNWLITLAQCTCNGGGGGGGSSSRITGLLILASFAVLWWLSRLVWHRWITEGTCMSRSIIVAVVVILFTAGATIIYPKLAGSAAVVPEPRQAEAAAPTSMPNTTGLPRLVDLGATKCIPCKKMAPILEELKKDYAGRLSVEFIDVWVNPEAGKPYDIKLIPTQIFYDPAGKERFRHEGFIAKEDILAKWKEIGFDLDAKTTP